jgi:hypothetical protein
MTTAALGNGTTVANLSIVSGGNATAPTLHLGSDTGTGFYSDTAGAIALSTNSTERLRVNSSGNIGIGTSNITNNLTINGTVQLNSSGGNSVLNVSTSGNIVFGKRYGDVMMGTFGNSGD